jgi:NTP pyrophosphatase (non-canonical NTP hydrolase)
MNLNQLIELAPHLNGIILHGRDDNPFTLSFRSNEMQSEAGELGDVIKKMERISYGVPGTKKENTPEVLQQKLYEEFGDVLLTIALLAYDTEVDLELAVRIKTEELLNRYQDLGILERSIEHARGIREITSYESWNPAVVGEG